MTELFKCLIDLLGHQLDGDGEYDGGVLLRGDGSQGLEVSQLEGGGALWDDVARLLQGFTGLLFSLSSDNLRRSLTIQSRVTYRILPWLGPLGKPQLQQPWLSADSEEAWRPSPQLSGSEQSAWWENFSQLKLKGKTYVNSPWISRVVNQALQVFGNGISLGECFG